MLIRIQIPNDLISSFIVINITHKGLFVKGFFKKSYSQSQTPQKQGLGTRRAPRPNEIQSQEKI